MHVARAVRNVQNRVIDHRRALLANAKQTRLLVQRVGSRKNLTVSNRTTAHHRKIYKQEDAMEVWRVRVMNGVK